MRRILILAIISLLSLFVIGCGEIETMPTSEQEDNTQRSDDLVDNPDIESQPTEQVTTNTEEESSEQLTGNVVATVNDEEITSEDVAEVQQSTSMQGQQISEDDALEEVINQKVLEQKVQQENIVVTDEEAESVIEQQLSMQGATLDDYKQQIESQGVSYEAELESIKNQIANQNYLESQLAGKSFEVSEEEAQEYYEMYRSQSTEEVPSYEELEEQMIATLEQEKQQEAINALIQELRADADVEYK